MKSFLPILAVSLLVLISTSCRPTYQKLAAWDTVHALKQSVLLVPLSDPEPEVSTLSRYGRDRRAKKLRKKYDKQNGKIMEAFNARWNFCPVYYYYVGDENHILNQGRRDLFLNGGLVRDASLAPTYSSYFLAEFQPLDEWQGDDIREVIALVIKDQQFRTLNSPFPNAEKVRSFKSRGSLRTSVKSLNMRLTRFYGKRNQYLARNR